MDRLLDDFCDPAQLGALNLAFVGDAVFDLLVRERLVCLRNQPVKKQHALAAAQVKAAAQAAAAQKLLPCLTAEETLVFKRGRNAHVHHKAKNATESDYHYATALEALFGYLYLNGDLDRLRTLFAYILEEEV